MSAQPEELGCREAEDDINEDSPHRHNSTIPRTSLGKSPRPGTRSPNKLDKRRRPALATKPTESQVCLGPSALSML